MGNLSKIFADGLFGTAWNVEAPCILPRKVTRKTITGNDKKKKETTEEFRKFSAVGGFFRTVVSSALVRGGLRLYRRDVPETPETRGGTNPPANVYDFHRNYGET